MRALVARKKTHREELAWLAWHTAALPLLKKFPKLEDLTPRPVKPQTPEVMLANLKLALGFSGETKPNG